MEDKSIRERYFDRWDFRILPRENMRDRRALSAPREIDALTPAQKHINFRRLFRGLQLLQSAAFIQFSTGLWARTPHSHDSLFQKSNDKGNSGGNDDRGINKNHPA